MIPRSAVGTAVAGALVSGLAQVLVFPRFSWGWLAPLCLVPLLLVLRDRPWKARLALGWLSGAVFWGGTCYWIYPVMRDYAGITPLVAGLLFVGFFLAKAVQAAAFAAIAGPVLSRPWPQAVPVLAVLWVALEGSHQFIAFTWLQIGTAAVDFPLPQLLRLAPWTGIHGPSLMFALANAAIALALLSRSFRPLLGLAPWLGLFLLPSLPAPGPGAQTARLVQPNVHPDLLRTDWLARQGTQHLADMREMSTASPDGDRPSLLVWPEYPVPAYYFDSAPHREFLSRVASEARAVFVFNTISFEDGDRARPRNSSVALDPSGAMLSTYSKMHLVPFGEFVPWPFHYIVEKVTLQAGSFRAGERVEVARAGGHGIGTFICYESVFARSIRRFTAAGAELLVNISNDSWYGRSAAREQHLLIARMRAVENARWILRATNDGITTAIGPSGRMEAALPSYVQDKLDVRFDYRSDLTAFVRIGEWVWWLCMLASLAWACWALVLARRNALQ